MRRSTRCHDGMRCRRAAADGLCMVMARVAAGIRTTLQRCNVAQWRPPHGVLPALPVNQRLPFCWGIRAVTMAPLVDLSR